MEYLLEEAKNNNLPVLKKRAIIRGYLQIIILNSIYKQKYGKCLFFMGGTAMRYFYRMPRFSEDLGFNTASLEYCQFEIMLDRIAIDLSGEGLPASISAGTRKNLFTAKLFFNDIMERYSISDKRGAGLMIKIEINRPGWELNTESRVLSMYGYSFTAVLMSRGNLLSEKILALLGRRRGRDIYDALYMLRNKFPLNENVLKINNVKLPAGDTILTYLNSMGEKELKRLASQVKPFLFKEDDIDLVIKAPLYAKAFLEEYAGCPNDITPQLKIQ
ncbi:MAG: nucleotidyl transferase AbiEii/AbiGii toxin family protein [Actinobacteria bacterium]|nr:nucleotidyl transferase AbiEii/AbiGii toxin family protein [Actinomycetota bacterium]